MMLSMAYDAARGPRRLVWRGRFGLERGTKGKEQKSNGGPSQARLRRMALLDRRRAITVGFLLSGLILRPQPVCAELSANELLRKVVDNELKAQMQDHSHWMYLRRTEMPGKQEKETEREIIQSKDGDLDRLLSVNGQALTAEQVTREDKRIQKLLMNPSEQRRLQRDQEQDNQKTEQLLKMLPDAVIASYAEHRGELVELTFSPNPNFHPSSHEAQVFHAMEDRIRIARKERRLAEIDGHLTNAVRFWGGLLGHLDKGGQFQVKQSEVASGHWEITALNINMRGKVFFFKTIEVQQNETRTGFQRVPDDLTLAQAAARLSGLNRIP
jgi:hypothetical protein